MAVENVPTPGSWKYQKTQGDPQVLTQDGTRLIAKVMGFGPSAADANGHLLAAAPDLLKALIVAQDWLGDKGVPVDHIEMKRIMAAIEKAEGRGL